MLASRTYSATITISSRATLGGAPADLVAPDAAHTAEIEAVLRDTSTGDFATDTVVAVIVLRGC